MYVFIHLHPHGKDVAQGQFVRGVQLVWIQSFPSPRLVAYLKLKSLEFLTKCWLFYVFIQSLLHEQDVTQGQFVRGVQLVWIQSFPSPRLVAYLKLKSLEFLTKCWLFYVFIQSLHHEPIVTQGQFVSTAGLNLEFSFP